MEEGSGGPSSPIGAIGRQVAGGGGVIVPSGITTVKLPVLQKTTQTYAPESNTNYIQTNIHLHALPPSQIGQDLLGNKGSGRGTRGYWGRETKVFYM